jgi:hypothetical protein
MVGRAVAARRELEEALDERELAQGRFEAAIGTSAEMRAYLRLRRATERVTAADRATRRAPAAETKLSAV